jgi:hypothetical protein
MKYFAGFVLLLFIGAMVAFGPSFGQENSVAQVNQPPQPTAQTVSQKAPANRDELIQRVKELAEQAEGLNEGNASATLHALTGSMEVHREAGLAALSALYAVHLKQLLKQEQPGVAPRTNSNDF